MLKRNSIFILLPLLLIGCGGVKDKLGVGAEAPDEFKVISNAPLSVPPDFTLRPPAPGAKRPQENTTDNQAREVLIQTLDEGQPRSSSSDRALLQRVGTDDVDPEIRAKLEEEERGQVQAARKKGIFGRTLDKLRGEDETAPDPLIAPSQEKERIQENKEQGKPVTEGETPTTGKEKKGLLNRILGW